MPRIPEITAQDTALHPTEVGIEANTQAAYRAGRFYNEAGEALKRAAADKAAGAQGIVRGTEALGKSVGQVAGGVAQGLDAAETFAAHQEISHGAAQFAQASANLTSQWNDAVKNSDPNKAGALASTFMQGTFQSWANGYVDSFNTPDGKAWARDQVMHLRAHMTEKTNADVMTMAADAVDKNVTEAARSWSNMARNDPSAVPWLLQSAGKSIDGIIASSPNISGVAAVKVRTEVLDKAEKAIVRAGGLGAIESAGDPAAAAAEWSKRYPDYVDAVEMDQFGKAAQYYKRLNVSAADADRVQRDYLAKQDFNTQADALLASTMPQNVGDGPVLPKDYWDQARKLATHPGAALEPGRLREIVTSGEAITKAQSKPEALAAVSHDTMTTLMPQIWSGQIKDESQIFQLYGENKLNNADLTMARKELAGTKTPEGEHVAEMKRQLAASVKPMFSTTNAARPLYGPSDKGDAFYRWQYELDRRMATLKQQGKNPLAVFDPSSPDYIWSPGIQQQFLGSVGAAVSANGGVGAPAINTAPPPKAAAGPAVGTISKGYRFKGGDPKNPASWEKVSNGPAT